MDKIVWFNILGQVTTSWTYSNYTVAQGYIICITIISPPPLLLRFIFSSGEKLIILGIYFGPGFNFRNWPLAIQIRIRQLLPEGSDLDKFNTEGNAENLPSQWWRCHAASWGTTCTGSSVCPPHLFRSSRQPKQEKLVIKPVLKMGG